MRLIIQRVLHATVRIDDTIHSQINNGLLIFLGITQNDTKDDIDWLIHKTINLRVFKDDKGNMNRSISEVKGELLIVSQFTLFASTKKGNRPSFLASAKPEVALPLYNSFIEEIRKSGLVIQSGVFGADMQIGLENDGPLTFILDSKNKE